MVGFYIASIEVLVEVVPMAMFARTMVEPKQLTKHSLRTSVYIGIALRSTGCLS